MTQLDTRAAGLAPWVAQIAPFDHHLDPSAVHFGRPSPYATVVLNLDQPMDVAWAGGDSVSGSRHWALVSGLHAEPALIRTHGRQCGVQLSLTPLGFRALTGAPIGAYAHVLTDLPLPPGVLESLAEATWADRLPLLSAYLRRTLNTEVTIASELQRAYELLTDPAQVAGGLRVTEVAHQVGWSRRQLSKRFGAEFGLSPKQLARITRFTASRRLAGTGLGWAQVAATAGYADQAHLVRDWVDLGGQTPTRAMAEEFPILQSEPPARQAG